MGTQLEAATWAATKTNEIMQQLSQAGIVGHKLNTEDLSRMITKTTIIQDVFRQGEEFREDPNVAKQGASLSAHLMKAFYDQAMVQKDFSVQSGLSKELINQALSQAVESANKDDNTKEYAWLTNDGNTGVSHQAREEAKLQDVTFNDIKLADVQRTVNATKISARAK